MSLEPKSQNNLFSGQEKSDFWSLLGGEAPYIKEREAKAGANEEFNPRLFHGSNATGVFRSRSLVCTLGLLTFLQLSKINFCWSKHTFLL